MVGSRCVQHAYPGAVDPASMPEGAKDPSEYACAYFDDIMAYTALNESASDPVDAMYAAHLQHIHGMLCLLRHFNVRCTLHKCAFFTSVIRFTGFILRRGTITTDPDKVRAIDALTPHLGYKHLQRFLGYLTYYGRSHIFHLSAKTKLLRSLLLKGTPFVWTPGHEASANALKAEVKNSILRYLPDFKKPFILATDYSADGLAAILSQRDQKGIERPVHMASRSTTPVESTFSAYEGELAAVQYGLQVCHHYLYGTTFVLQTDHEALTYLERNAFTNSRLGRLAALLKSNYSFTVEYKKGRLNANADALSRSPACPGVAEVHDIGTSVLDDLTRSPLPSINMFKWISFSRTFHLLSPVNSPALPSLLFLLARPFLGGEGPLLRGNFLIMTPPRTPDLSWRRCACPYLLMRTSGTWTALMTDPALQLMNPAWCAANKTTQTNCWYVRNATVLFTRTVWKIVCQTIWSLRANTFAWSANHTL